MRDEAAAPVFVGGSEGRVEMGVLFLEVREEEVAHRVARVGVGRGVS